MREHAAKVCILLFVVGTLANGNSMAAQTQSSTEESGISVVTTPVANDGVITHFDEEELVHVGLYKWLISVDQGIEVRTSINGVVPQRGQFLVIWFEQKSQSGEPLPMGNFELMAGAEEKGPFEKYSLSEEGTTSLILNEYNWNPNIMSEGTPYRTGIAFDIRPEDFYFQLILDLGPANDLWERKPIQLKFEA